MCISFPWHPCLLAAGMLNQNASWNLFGCGKGSADVLHKSSLASSLPSINSRGLCSVPAQSLVLQGSGGQRLLELMSCRCLVRLSAPQGVQGSAVCRHL